MTSEGRDKMKLYGLSLFSSVGMSETYFSDYDIEVKVANEWLETRAKFHKHLYPDCKMIVGDITDKQIKKDIIDSAIAEKCDFVIATPPCQGMSSAGLQKKDDARNRLIIDAVEIIKKIKPKFIILENVPEQLQTSILINGEWVLIPDYLKKELGAKYNFNCNNVVNAMNYNVAQSRKRCVFLLARKDMGFVWEFPESTGKILAMRDVIGNLPSLDPDVTDISDEERKKLFPDYEKKKKAGQEVSKWHYPPKHKMRHVIAMQHTPEGCTAWNNEVFYPTLKDGTKGKGYKNTYKRQWWDKPAYTVTMYTSRIGSQENGHPGYAIVDSPDEEKRLWSDARVLSIYELMMVSSLPSDWNIPDWASSNVIREAIGEGVPPKLIAAALESLRQNYE